MKLKNETLSKHFLIYGFGKSGISALKYLKKKNKCFIFDDDKKKIKNKKKKFFISKSKLLNNNFDYLNGIDSFIKQLINSFDIVQ